MLSSGFGGGERLFVDLCAALADEGHLVQAVCHHRFVGLPALARLRGVRVSPVPVLGPWDRLGAWRLARAVRAFAPHVMHSHLARGALFAGRAARRLGVPLLANLHNYVNLRYYRGVERFLAATEDQRRYLREQGVAPERIGVVPHFSRLPVARVPLEGSAPASPPGRKGGDAGGVEAARGWREAPGEAPDGAGEGAGARAGGRPPGPASARTSESTAERGPGGAQPADAMTLVACGRLVHKKGFDVLLEALARVRSEGVPARLLLGGAGPQEGALRGQAAALGLTEAVHFAGWVEDVAEFLRGGQIFVLPSRDEPFGIAVLEAMASGRALVATRSQGPREILHDATAWLAEPGDPHSLARALREALASPGERRRRAEAALRRYRCRYSPEAVLPSITSHYRELVAARDA